MQGAEAQISFVPPDGTWLWSRGWSGTSSLASSPPHSPKEAPTRAKQDRSQRKAMVLRAGSSRVCCQGAPLHTPGPPPSRAQPRWPGHSGDPRATLTLTLGPWAISQGQVPLTASAGSQTGARQLLGTGQLLQPATQNLGKAGLH